MKDYLTVEQLAKKLKVKRQAIRYYEEQDRLVPPVIMGYNTKTKRWCKMYHKSIKIADKDNKLGRPSKLSKSRRVIKT